MKTSEFRIGNLVQDEKGIFYFVAGLNGSTDSRLTLAAYNKEVVKGWQDAEVNALPIKLTEEILLKCGFKKLQYDNCYSIWNEPFDLKIEYTNGTFLFFKGSAQGHAPVSNLHQLQNFVFAYTGKELIYDPK